MPSIRALGLSFAHTDAVPLFTDADFVLEPGWTGLVGPNGAGKTTLLSLLARRRRPTGGSLRFVPDDPVIHLCEQRVEEPGPEVESFAWSWEAGAPRLRDLLQLEPESLLRWPTLSPGERKRWQVGAALSLEPDVLLLDEPTNHLDAEARDRLAAALGGFGGVGVLVSHDRALLESLARRTLWLEAGELELYDCGYGAAREIREARYARQIESLTRAQEARRQAHKRLVRAREVQRQTSAQRSTAQRMRNRHDSDARTLGADFLAEKAEKRAGKAVQAASREAALAATAVESVELRKELGRSIFLHWEPAPRSTLIALDRDEIAVGERVLLRDVHLVVGRSDRIHVAGPNGAGKSTLLAALLDAARLPPEKVLHLPQELGAAEGRAAVAELRALPPEERGRVLSLVAALGLDPDRLLVTDDPSPGEARKLRIAMGMARHAWLLVLDEPTNHLDLPAIERLEAALVAWPGALVLVTHDAALAERCTDRGWRLSGGVVVQV